MTAAITAAPPFAVAPVTFDVTPEQVATWAAAATKKAKAAKAAWAATWAAAAAAADRMVMAMFDAIEGAPAWL